MKQRIAETIDICSEDFLLYFLGYISIMKFYSNPLECILYEDYYRISGESRGILSVCYILEKMIRYKRNIPLLDP